jgi:hypothetical protein
VGGSGDLTSLALLSVLVRLLQHNAMQYTQQVLWCICSSVLGGGERGWVLLGIDAGPGRDQQCAVTPCCRALLVLVDNDRSGWGRVRFVFL